MTQVEEGSAPFNKLPQEAADVQIFPNMLNSLISAWKIVKKGHKTLLDDPIATIINKAKNEVVMKGIFDDRTSPWSIYPDGSVDYDFKKEQEVDSLGLGVQQQQGGYIIHLTNNVYCLTTKIEIVEYYDAVAGWLVKKTWIAAIQRNAYASWPGLIENMVHQHLEPRKSTILGHMNVRRSGTQTTTKKITEKSYEEKMECILNEENSSLEKFIPSILQSRK